MDWVKLYTSYFDDLVLAISDDAAEVMFTRGLAYCGRAETGGFIPSSQLHHLTRSPARAKRIAGQLVRQAPDGSEGPWEVVDGGYRVRNWSHYQSELDALSSRRRSDRERKRRQRDKKKDESTGPSRDSHGTSPHTESKSKKKTAAAAAEDAAAAAVTEQLPTAVEILRSRLQAHTALTALRFDGLTPDRLALLEELIARHGDQRLVDTALRTLRTPPPVHVSAFLGTWSALPAPGQRLAVVRQELCPDHGVQLSATGVCPAHEADRKAGTR